MKKLFIVLAVASLGFVACNNESASEENKDTVSTTVAPNGDTAVKTVEVDTTVKSAGDTTIKTTTSTDTASKK